MTPIQFLAEWALRSSILILCGALLLGALRVKDSSVRLAAWTAMLCGSLAMPVFTAAFPKVPIAVMRAAPRQVRAPVRVDDAPIAPTPVVRQLQTTTTPKPVDWASAGLALYGAVALTLLLRLCVGLAMSLRLLRGSRATDRKTEGIEIRESDRVAAPVTLGVLRPAIVLPVDWRQWDGKKLDAVLAHERSHIRRCDPAVQLLSAIHRALLWHSPLSWFLHRRIVRVAEEASDDAALLVEGDRARYAEVLLDFMRRGVRGASLPGVPMARYGRADQRIQRILDGTSLSRGVTRWSVVAILALGSPLAYVVAAAHPQDAPQAQTPAPPVPKTAAKPIIPDAVPLKREPSAAPVVAQAETPSGDVNPMQRVMQFLQQVQAATPRPTTVWLTGLGSVAPFSTVIVKPRVDGELLSVSFKEGELVQAGQVLANVAPRLYQLQLAQAEGQLARDEAPTIAHLEGAIQADRAAVDIAKLQLTYTTITAPITGVAGLRLVDPGNIVHASDALVVITQLQPIAVLCSIPEDNLPQVRALLDPGANPPVVEAWNRDNSVRLATGHLTAIDNQIDQATGTAKLKAVFDNKDSALFPGQFVNVRLALSGQ